jgi:hypothetical protein
MQELQTEFETLTQESHGIEAKINENFGKLFT